jgi:hypothetical protein
MDQKVLVLSTFALGVLASFALAIYPVLLR